MKEIVVDASVVIKVVVPEDMSDKADTLISDAKASGIKLIAPHLYDPEIVSVLSRKVWEGNLTNAQADAALRVLKNVPVKLLSFAGQVDKAWIIARQFNMFATLSSLLRKLPLRIRCFLCGISRT